MAKMKLELILPSLPQTLEQPNEINTNKFCSLLKPATNYAQMEVNLRFASIRA